MDGLITTLVGIIGTLSGTLLGWFLNSQSYKLGKTKIYATLIKSITIPVQMGDDTTTCESTSSQKYLFECVAYNSKQIPVILKNFHIELLTDRHSNPISAPILLPEISYTEINGIKIGAELALPRQLIMPRTLHEFTFKVNYHNDDIYDIGRLFYDYVERNHELTWDVVKITFDSAKALNDTVLINSGILDICKGFFDDTFKDRIVDVKFPLGCSVPYIENYDDILPYVSKHYDITADTIKSCSDFSVGGIDFIYKNYTSNYYYYDMSLNGKVLYNCSFYEGISFIGLQCR